MHTTTKTTKQRETLNLKKNKRDPRGGGNDGIISQKVKWFLKGLILDIQPSVSLTSILNIFPNSDWSLLFGV